MKWSSWGYYFRTTGQSLRRNGWMTMASVGTVTVSLLVAAIVFMLVLNIMGLVQAAEADVMLTVRLTENADQAALVSQIQSIPGVASVQGLTPQQELERLRSWYPGSGDFLEGLDADNPLRPSIEVTMNNPRDIPTAAEQIKPMAGVETVDYGQGIAQQLFQVSRTIRLVGAILVIGLIVAGIFVISNTIRLTVFARRREIAIMKFVGATDWFVRWPFIIEGVILGALGALISWSLIAAGYDALFRAAAANLPFFPLAAPWPLLATLGGYMLVLGVVIGAMGSGISLRRHLRV
jgi:cell division transport system permease protein